jgi:cytochrome c-type protein NapC
MSNADDNDGRRGVISRFWRFLWRPSTRFSLAALLVVGFVGGILFWGGFHWALELTNTEEFCVSCHEMDKPFEELKQTIHFVNRTGIRAICSDCHVPKEWVYKIRRKIVATKDLVFHLTGKIDTPEKYKEHHLEMALTVWRQMKGSDSRECRNCHEAVWMDMSEQWGGAARNHELALENGLTCIDCHQGIAHELPEEFNRPEDSELVENANAWLAEMEAAVAAKN